MRYLSACLVTKDENGYLPEWVAYHRLAGFEHFYVYDNESSVPVEETLAPEVQEGIATVMRIRGSGIQLDVYSACLRDFGRETRWMSFTDGDEFLVGSREDDVRAVLLDHERHGGLAINWLVFGSSGHAIQPPGLQMEAFRFRAARPYDLNRYVKWVVQPAMVNRMATAHMPAFKDGVRGANEVGTPATGPMGVPHSSARIQLNHYYFRSRQEWEAKVARGRVNRGGRLPIEAFDIHDRHCNVEPDAAILRFAPAVRDTLSRRRSER